MNIRRVSISRYLRLTDQNVWLTGEDGGTCYGDSGGPQLFDDSDTIIGVTHGGDNLCLETNIPQRIDIPSVREFLANYVDLDGQCPSPLDHPRPEFTVTTGALVGGQDIELDATGSTPAAGSKIITYEWSFGDGNTAVGAVATHRYDRTGLYFVRLVVRDDRGLWLAKSRGLAVLPVLADVSPWNDENIGESELVGGSFYQDDCLVVTGADGTISGRQDQFHFTHQRVTGDFQLTARIEDWTAASTGSRIGLMIREGTDPAARHATVLLEATSTGLQHQLRRRSGLLTRNFRHERYEVADVWLRVERRGNSLSGSLSLDGIQWLEPDAIELTDLADLVHVGVASAWDAPPEGGPASLATFCDLALSPLEPESPTNFLRGDCDADGTACSSVNDALTLLNWLFLGRAEPPCLAACNPDGNGELELADAVYGLNYCFKGTDAPVAPFPECGPGKDSDFELGCDKATPDCR